MWRGAMFLLLIVSRSNTKVHLSADACSLDWPGGTRELLMGLCRLVLQILTLFQTEKCHFFRVPPGPLYQNEVKCSAFDMKMILHSHVNKTRFH